MISLQFYYVQIEILDIRECRYVLVSQDQFWNDIKMLQDRVKEYGNCPSVNDAARFPNRATLNECLVFNVEYQRYLESRIAFGYYGAGRQRDEYALKEARRLYSIYDVCRDTSTEYYYIVHRRNALRKLKELIGDEMYYSGELPPYVPIHLFDRID